MVAAAIAAGSLIGASSTQTAVANGDTRTLHFYHTHTGESIDATFRVDGHYDPAVLRQLNHFLRDWRNNDEISMDPRLFDTLWEVYRTAGATDRIQIYSAYRSPETNAMLRRRSRAVAEHSQHMLGKAMDTTIPGFPMHLIREVGMKLQRGGVGWYPTMNFVHLDVGGVRSWPRMPYDQLAQLFPDGKTVHVASNGQVLPGYEAARQEIAARGAEAPPSQESGGFFAWLFGGSGSSAGREDEEERSAPAVVARAAPQPAPQPAAVPEATLAYAERPAATAPMEAIVRGGLAGDRPVPEGAAPDKTGDGAAQAQDARTADPQTADSQAVDSRPATEVLPLPPRRPFDLAALEIPMPPARPDRLSRGAVLASTEETVVRRSAPDESVSAEGPRLPALITGDAALPGQGLAFAAMPGSLRGQGRAAPERYAARSIGLRAALRGSMRTADDAGDVQTTGTAAGLTGLRRAARALTLKAAL